MTSLRHSRIDCIAQPGQDAAIDRDHVEAARWRHLVTLQINLGRDDQARLLGGCHAGCGTAMPRIGAFPDLDKDERIVWTVLSHDEIDFAALAAKIALHQRESLYCQMIKRSIFANLTLNLFGGSRTHQCIE